MKENYNENYDKSTQRESKEENGDYIIFTDRENTIKCAIDQQFCINNGLVFASYECIDYKLFIGFIKHGDPEEEIKIAIQIEKPDLKNITNLAKQEIIKKLNNQT